MRRFLLLVFVLACAAAPAPVVPDTPAGQAFDAWQTAFNAGDRDTYEAFVKAKYPSHEKYVDTVMEFRRQTGGFDLREVLSSEPAQLVVLLEDRLNEQFARLTVKVDASGALAGIDLQAVPTPAEFEPPHLSETDLVAALNGRLPKAAADGLFSGAVLVAKDGVPAFEQAYGFADREKDVSNTLDTRFRIGSMNKMFTAVSILQLVQSGKAGLDDPLGKYLTDYPNKDVASQVTIRELLTHTGGTGDIFGSDFDAQRLALRTLADYEKLYGNRGPEFEPGSKWEYSNYGFILLGLVIEKVSGESYYQYVDEHVYAPAGMTSSGSDPEESKEPQRSVGYMDDNGKIVPNTDTLPWRGTSAGGGYSTVGDLLKFALALQSHKLLDAEHTELLTTGKIDTPSGDEYAFGFTDGIKNGTRCFGHGGGAPGMNGELDICPGPGYVVVVLANLDPPAASRVANYVVTRLPNEGHAARMSMTVPGMRRR